MSINAANNSTRTSIRTVGDATESAARAAHGRNRNIPGNGNIPTGRTGSPLIAAPVAGMGHSCEKAIRFATNLPAPRPASLKGIRA